MTAQHAVITDNPQGITSVSNHPQGVPAYMANLWITYDFSIAGMPGFHVGAGLNYLDKSYSDITNVNSIHSYVIANAAFGFAARHWGVDVNVHNITDRRYFIAANAAGAYVGQPLSAFVTLHSDFLDQDFLSRIGDFDYYRYLHLIRGGQGIAAVFERL